MERKTIIILIIAVFCLNAFLAGFLINRFDFSFKLPDRASILEGFTDNGSQEINTVSTPESQNTALPISKVRASSLILSLDKNSVLFYEKDSGRAMESGISNGKEQIILNNQLPNFLSTIWSPNRKEVISLFYGPTGNQYKYYNYSTKQSVAFDKNIKSVAFSPDGREIAYFKTVEGGGEIYLAETDGSSPKKILNTALGEAELWWPGENIIFKTKNISEGGWVIFSVDKDGGLRKVLKENYPAEELWGPNKALVSWQEDKKARLMLKDFNSGEEKSIALATTANKCAWSIDPNIIYCAIKHPLYSSREEIIEFNLATNEQKVLASPVTALDTKEILISGLEDYAVIHNVSDDFLYSVKIK